MGNPYFKFKQFTVLQDRCAMKVTTDACLFGAWVAKDVASMKSPTGNSENGFPLVLDVGTGTGLLSLMLVQKNPLLDVNAIEIDPQAAQQVEENFLKSPWPDSFYVMPDDARSFDFNYEYDIIICNPPFYENELKSDDKQKNIAHHSEDLTTQDVFGIIKQNLSNDGHFYLLLPYKRYPEIKTLFEQFALHLSDVVLFKQSVNHSYFRFLLKGGKKQDDAGDIMINEISIKDANDAYTDEFIELLKDYYLHL